MIISRGAHDDYFTGHTYTLDAVGSRTFVDEVLPDGSFAEPLDEDREATIEYEYDGIYRLVHEDRDWPGGSDDEEFTYVYDPIGNRIEQTRYDPPSTYEITTIEYDQADRIVEAFGHYDTEYVVDHNGNITTRDAGTFDDFDFTYDQENRLVFSNDGTTDDFAYFYDANGNRQFIGEVWPLDIVNWYVYDTENGLPLVLQDKDHKYVWGLDLLYAVDDDDDAFYYHYDGSGSVRVVTEEDEDPRSRSRYQYNAYGESQDITDFFDQPFMFAGQQNDSYDDPHMPDTDLYYMRARYYDPVTGRFITRDPYKGDIRSPMTLNPYVYALGNPANYTDPSGLFVAGACADSEGGFGYYQALSICLVVDTQSSIGLVVSHDEGGSSGISLGGGFSFLSHSAETLEDLAGENWSLGGSVGGGLKLAGELEIVYDHYGNPVPLGYSIGPQLGGGLSVPGGPWEVHYTHSQTTTRRFVNLAELGRKVWDWLFPSHNNVWVAPKR